MGDNYWARIEIGGKVPRWLVPRLREMIASNFNDWDLDTPFDEGIVFTACESAARNGKFEELEEFLVEHRIHFDRQCGHYCEYDGGLVQYRGEDEDPQDILGERRVDADGILIWGWEEVIPALNEALQESFEAMEGESNDAFSKHLLGRLEHHMDPKGAKSLEEVTFTDACNICGKPMGECEHLKALIEKDPEALSSWVADFVAGVISKSLEGFIASPLSEEDMRVAGIRLLKAWWDVQGCEMDDRSGHVWTKDKEGNRRDLGRVPLDTVKYDGERLESSFLPALPVNYVAINLSISNKEDPDDGPPQD